MDEDTDLSGHRAMDPAPTFPLEQARFRRVMSRFGTGIVVVAGMADGVPTGLTCQSFMSLSLDPPLVAVAVALTSLSWATFASTGAFSINILHEHQEPVSRSFAVSGGDKFAEHAWYRGKTGPPLLRGALAHIECEIESVARTGDHDLIVGRVLAVHDIETPYGPLLYYRSAYHTLNPGPIDP